MDKAKLLLIAAITGAAVYVIVSDLQQQADVQDEGINASPPDVLTATVDSTLSDAQEVIDNTDIDMSTQNEQAFLAMLRASEGTDRAANPYAVCYAYHHTIQNFADHPAITGEWLGEELPLSMGQTAGGKPLRSTAAGAYQIIKGTWASIKNSLGLPDFSPASQDSAALELIRRRGALADVRAGRLASAIDACKKEWASLPGANYAGQGMNSLAKLQTAYINAGGTLA